jgi:DNA-directed RNA polymerase alpha subunit
METTKEIIGLLERAIAKLKEEEQRRIADRQPDKFHRSIREAGFSTRTTNALVCCDCDTVYDLVTKFRNEKELFMMRNIGDKSVMEIRDFLKENNLKLGM